jgi:hypothetical protein
MGLGIEIDEAHAAARLSQAGRKIDAGGRLSDAPLLIHDRDDAHSRPPWRCETRNEGEL